MKREKNQKNNTYKCVSRFSVSLPLHMRYVHISSALFKSIVAEIEYVNSIQERVLQFPFVCHAHAWKKNEQLFFYIYSEKIWIDKGGKISIIRIRSA